MIRSSGDRQFTGARGPAGQTPPQLVAMHRGRWLGSPSPGQFRHRAVLYRGPLPGPFGALPPSANRGFQSYRGPPPLLHLPSFEQQHQQVSSRAILPPDEQQPSKKIKILVNQNRIGGGTVHSGNKRNTPPPSGHQLQDNWSFWYLRFEKNFSWEHSQMELASCRTVEQFWGIFDQLVPLTEAHHGCNYSLFKTGIRPIWEDPMNRHGGRFVFTIFKEESPYYKDFVDHMWLEFAMAVVGNILPDVSDQICGIIGGNRNNVIKIAVWTHDRTKTDEIKQIGMYFKRIANYSGPVPYEAHMDNQMQRSSSKTILVV